jgi:antitoxin MazE
MARLFSFSSDSGRETFGLESGIQLVAKYHGSANRPLPRRDSKVARRPREDTLIFLKASKKLPKIILSVPSRHLFLTRAIVRCNYLVATGHSKDQIMKTNVVRIGNSRGIRIPKKLLEECRLEETVELEAHKGHLVVRPAAKPRAGWDEAFRRMAEKRDDALLDRDSLASTKWDRTEWRW